MVDCPAYHLFARLQSIYGSTLYMNPKPRLKEVTQINTLYRIYILCKRTGFLTVQRTDVSVPLKVVVAELKEEVKFIKLIDN